MGGDLSDDLSGYEGDDRICGGPGHDAWILGGPGKTPFAVVRADPRFSASKPISTSIRSISSPYRQRYTNHYTNVFRNQPDATTRNCAQDLSHFLYLWRILSPAMRNDARPEANITALAWRRSRVRVSSGPLSFYVDLQVKR